MATDLGKALVPSTEPAASQGLADIDQVMAHPTTGGNVKTGYSLWSFDGGVWSLSKNRSAEGYLPSSAPSVPGRFKGQVRAILSVPADA